MMEELFIRYPVLEICKSEIEETAERIKKMYRNGGKLLLCGNGGSCADCEHIVGELMKDFLIPRHPHRGLVSQLKALYGADGEFIAANLQRGLPAIALHSQCAFSTAFCNDVRADLIYAQAVYGFANNNDLLFCISTSGNSSNIVYAAKLAKALGIPVCSMTGQSESELSRMSDVTIRVPETETYRIQELHLPIYHAICIDVERYFSDCNG